MVELKCPDCGDKMTCFHDAQDRGDYRYTCWKCKKIWRIYSLVAQDESD